MNNEKERTHIMIVDSAQSPEPWFIDITAEQRRLFNWLRNHDFFNEDCEIYDISDDSIYEEI